MRRSAKLASSKPRRVLCFALLIACVIAANAPAQVAGAAPSPSPHIVVVISLGGFRWDYVKRDSATNLLAIGKSGVSAPNGMLPSYPASTWPNAWTLVTGLYPGHHGIVGDQFFDPVSKLRFHGEGSFFGGIPIWSLAEKQGIRTACVNWLGCAVKIAAAERPSRMPSSETSSAGAASQILAWLRISSAERPRLILAWFGDVSEAAQRYGPDAPETRAAVRSLDKAIGKLKSDIDELHLPVDLVVVSDHGIAKPESSAWMTLESQADLTGFQASNTLIYGQSDADSERVYNKLKQASADFVAYRLRNAPSRFHLNGNVRFGDPVVIALKPIALRAHAPTAAAGDAPPLWVDGLDAQAIPEMKAIFFAAGPDIVEGKALAPFENVNIYPWIAHLLNLTPPKNDGSLGILSGTLRDDGGDADQ